MTTQEHEVGAASERVLKQLTQARTRDGRDRRTVRLAHLVGHLLVFGRVSPDDLASARLVVVTAPMVQCDLGEVDLRWSTEQHALGRCVSGWVAVRVSESKTLLAPSVADMALVRKRLRELGWDWRFAPFEQRRWAS